MAGFQARSLRRGSPGRSSSSRPTSTTSTGTTQSAHLVVPAEGEPVLLVRRTLERARGSLRSPRVEPLRSLRDLPAALAAAGLAGGALGLELDVLPAAALPRLRASGCRASSSPTARRLLRRLRAVKSPWELERIREAAAMLAGRRARRRRAAAKG